MNEYTLKSPFEVWWTTSTIGYLVDINDKEITLARNINDGIL